MEYTFDKIITKTRKPFLPVDYNELLDVDVVMLSQSDIAHDYSGVPLTLYEGLEVVGYQEDEDINRNRDDMIMEGVCIRNRTGQFEHVKWLLQANDKGLRYMSDIIEQGW